MALIRSNKLLDGARNFLRDRTLHGKALSFAMVGVVNTVVDFSVFSFAYFYLQLPIIPANIMSWTIAVTGSFVMNSLFTFSVETGGKLRLKSYGKFIVAQLSGLVANTTTVFVASYFMPVLMGKALAMVVSFSVNFSLSNFVVFRQREPKPEDAH